MGITLKSRPILKTHKYRHYGEATWKWLNGHENPLIITEGKRCKHDNDDTKTMVSLQTVLAFKSR